MLFNSFDFAIFLPVVFFLYWFVFQKNLKIQNLFIVIASFVFYGWWDWRFLFLLCFSIVTDYWVGLELDKMGDQRKRKLILWISIIVNIGILGFFKYYNFFVENFAAAFSLFGREISTQSLKIVLPVGISFYTFQTLSYTIDVYRRKFEPTKDLIAFTAFVSFFPQLVAGPIERATNLLPQFFKRRHWDYAKAADGTRQILWGLFKKMVIADGCADYVDAIFDYPAGHTGSSLLFGAVMYTFQVYCDFSGYSDIAIGTAHLFGFNLMRNFAFPYFSRDIAEFWRRWHISLTTWFRDYLYIPLGGSRVGTWKKIRNVFIIFIISAFWHGADWTYIAWGVMHVAYFLPLMLTRKNRIHMDTVAQGRRLPSFNDLLNMSYTMALVIFARIFFRANNMGQALDYIKGLFSSSLFTEPDFMGKRKAIILIVHLLFFLYIEWLGREDQYAIEKVGLSWRRPVRYAFYYILFISIFLFAGGEKHFIYFQF